MIIKNSNFRSNLFSNRYKILGIIVAIILTLCTIRVLNQISRKKLQEKQITNSVEQTTYKPQETVISGGDVSDEQQELNTSIMDTFIKYCNEKQIEKAYNLLTDECKENLFNNNVETFGKNYVEKVYSSYKTYSMQSWIKQTNSITYKIRITQDMLATGNVGNTIEDYYTIVKQNGMYKLNINSYIGRKTINKEVTQNNINIQVNYKDIYMNYEIYNIKIQNNTEKTILLDSKENEKSVYLTGNNKEIYKAFMYELDDVYLTIKSKLYKTLDIKFNKIYSSSVTEQAITFSDIVTDIENTEKTKITIEL